jgi:hypothetical protein
MEETKNTCSQRKSSFHNCSIHTMNPEPAVTPRQGYKGREFYKDLKPIELDVTKKSLDELIGDIYGN